MNELEMIRECDPHTLLAYKIIERAILDWRLIIQGGKSAAKVSTSEIRGFLKSQWCEELLSGTCFNGEWVLQKMEEELEQSSVQPAKEEPKTRKKPMRKPITIDGRTASAHTWSRELGVGLTAVYRWYNQNGREYVEQQLTAIKREHGL